MSKFLATLDTRPLEYSSLFLNGFPLGMIWGLVFSYVEGRRTTELMAAILSIRGPITKRNILYIKA